MSHSYDKPKGRNMEGEYSCKDFEVLQLKIEQKLHKEITPLKLQLVKMQVMVYVVPPIVFSVVQFIVAKLG